MFGIHDYEAFLLAGVLLNLTPGQDTIYIVTRSMAHGRRAGVASALGISTGCLAHIAAATFGLSAVLAASTVAFNLVKWAGVAYLTYLGLRQLLERAAETPRWPEARGTTGRPGTSATDGRALLSAYRSGILTNVLNPKVSVFFLAFLPQFVEPGPHRAPAFLVLGLTFLATGTAWCLCLALMAGSASTRIASSRRAAVVIQRLSGLVLVGLGLRLARAQAR